MKFLLTFLLIVALSVGVIFVLPSVWWGVAIAAFLGSILIKLNAWKSFISGFLAIGLVWGGYAFLLNQANEGLLSDKIANLIGISDGALLIIITAVIGALVGGFSAATGSLGRQLVKK